MEPIREITENADIDGSIIADKTENAKKDIGFDAPHMEWIDMGKAGTIDPTKVTCSVCVAEWGRISEMSRIGDIGGINY